MVQQWNSRILGCCIGAFVVCPAMAGGQVTTATVYGNVTDGSGAQIPGAPVVIVNEETGAVADRHDEHDWRIHLQLPARSDATP